MYARIFSKPTPFYLSIIGILSQLNQISIYFWEAIFNKFMETEQEHLTRSKFSIFSVGFEPDSWGGEPDWAFPGGVAIRIRNWGICF